jgi:acyl CoA:acetate/3-ketoacid CoA transferase alpha subunit
MGAQTDMNEQRWSQRRNAKLDVDVFDHGSLVTSCSSRDVGLGGVFLETSMGCFTENQVVDLCFFLGEENIIKHNLKAKVVRIMDSGAGLKFKDFDTSSFRTLQEIMRHSDREATV